jgi:hypothetical protein
VDLAEAGAAVTVQVANKRRHGRIAGVGRDFVVLQPDRGLTALVDLHAIDSLGPEHVAVPLPAGTRGGAIDLTLMMALALLAEQRTPVTLATRSGLETAGDLVAVGEDVLSLRTDMPTRRFVYFPLSAVALCELR